VHPRTQWFFSFDVILITLFHLVYGKLDKVSPALWVCWQVLVSRFGEIARIRSPDSTKEFFIGKLTGSCFTNSTRSSSLRKWYRCVNLPMKNISTRILP
jgi:hypothetical protein